MMADEAAVVQRAIWESRCPELLTRCDELKCGLEELLAVAERIRGGDPKLDPEEWYAARDYARVALARLAHSASALPGSLPGGAPAEGQT